jgi:hypothetical protein
MKREKEKEKTTPFGVNIMRSQVLCRAAQGNGYMPYSTSRGGGSFDNSQPTRLYRCARVVSNLDKNISTEQCILSQQQARCLQEEHVQIYGCGLICQSSIIRVCCHIMWYQKEDQEEISVQAGMTTVAVAATAAIALAAATAAAGITSAAATAAIAAAATGLAAVAASATAATALAAAAACVAGWLTEQVHNAACLLSPLMNPTDKKCELIDWLRTHQGEGGDEIHAGPITQFLSEGVSWPAHQLGLVSSSPLH